MSLFLIKTLIISIGFIVINFLSFILFAKDKTPCKIVFVVLLTLLEIGTIMYVNTHLIFLNTAMFTAILSIMAIKDIEILEAPGWTIIALPICSIINFILLCVKLSMFCYANIISAVILFLCFVVIGKIYKNSIGGADIVVVTSIGLTYGAFQALYTLIYGCSASLIFAIVLTIIKRKKLTGTPLPFLPGLTLGFLLSFFMI